MPRLSLIAALDRNRGIGHDGAMPWHLPEDLRRFRTLTMGKPILMGRRTHESIGRVLDGRRNIVVTAHPSRVAPGCEVAVSLDGALGLAGAAEEVMVIGGAMLYAAAIGRVERMYLTLLDEAFAADAFFPRYAPQQWREVAREERRGPQTPHPHVYVTLERTGPG